MPSLVSLNRMLAGETDGLSPEPEDEDYMIEELNGHLLAEMSSLAGRPSAKHFPLTHESPTRRANPGLDVVPEYEEVEVEHEHWMGDLDSQLGVGAQKIGFTPDPTISYMRRHPQKFSAPAKRQKAAANRSAAPQASGGGRVVASTGEAVVLQADGGLAALIGAGGHLDSVQMLGFAADLCRSPVEQVGSANTRAWTPRSDRSPRQTAGMFYSGGVAFPAPPEGRAGSPTIEREGTDAGSPYPPTACGSSQGGGEGEYGALRKLVEFGQQEGDSGPGLTALSLALEATSHRV